MDNRHMKRCSASLIIGDADQNRSEIPPYTHEDGFCEAPTTRTSVGEDVETLGPSCTAGGNVKRCRGCGKLEVP